MKPLAHHLQFGAEREEWRHQGGHDLGGHHEHQAIGERHQFAVEQDVSLAMRIIGTDQLIGETELAAEIRGPGFLGEERIRAGFDQTVLYTLTDNYASAILARFKKHVLYQCP